MPEITIQSKFKMGEEVWWIDCDKNIKTGTIKQISMASTDADYIFYVAQEAEGNIETFVGENFFFTEEAALEYQFHHDFKEFLENSKYLCRSINNKNESAIIKECNRMVNDFVFRRDRYE